MLAKSLLRNHISKFTLAVLNNFLSEAEHVLAVLVLFFGKSNFSVLVKIVYPMHVIIIVEVN